MMIIIMLARLGMTESFITLMLIWQNKMINEITKAEENLKKLVLIAQFYNDFLGNADKDIFKKMNELYKSLSVESRVYLGNLLGEHFRVLVGDR